MDLCQPPPFTPPPPRPSSDKAPDAARTHTHTPSQAVSAPEGSSPSALLVPAGQATHCLSDTNSFSQQPATVTEAVRQRYPLHLEGRGGGGQSGCRWVGTDRKKQCNTKSEKISPSLTHPHWQRRNRRRVRTPKISKCQFCDYSSPQKRALDLLEKVPPKINLGTETCETKTSS